MGQVFKIASSSQETLHTLQLPISMIPHYVDYSHFLAEFSHLEHLIVSAWHFWPKDVDQYDRLRRFLLSRPNLLISSQQGHSCFSSANFAIIQDRLEFKSLSMSPYQFRKVVKKNPRAGFLKVLHTFKIVQSKRAGEEKDYPELSDVMPVTIQKANGVGVGPLFQSIRHLTLAFVYIGTHSSESTMDPTSMTVTIHEFGQLCGSELQTLTVCLPLRTFTIRNLAFAFSAYPSVEEITIQGGLLEENLSEGVYAIALLCPSLRKLTLKNLDVNEELDKRPIASLRIERDTGEEIVVTTDPVI